MDDVTVNNFKAIRDAINTLTKKIEDQEKRINTYIQTQQMQMLTINTLKQEVSVLKAMSMGTGPTVK
jgi:hypothetical protein